MFILSGCGWLPANTIKLIHSLYNIVRFLIPILIVIMGAIDFIKSIAAANSDAIKKNTSSFIQKLVAAAIAFIIPATVNQIAKIIGDNYSNKAMLCVNQILNGTYQADPGLHVVEHGTETEQECYAREISSCMGSGKADGESCKISSNNACGIRNNSSNKTTTTTKDAFTRCQDDPQNQAAIQKCIQDYEKNGGIAGITASFEGIEYDSCLNDFTWGSGGYANACEQLEDCIGTTSACEEIHQEWSTNQNKSCDSQYQQYHKYYNTYKGEYTDLPGTKESICQNYSKTDNDTNHISYEDLCIAQACPN